MNTPFNGKSTSGIDLRTTTLYLVTLLFTLLGLSACGGGGGGGTCANGAPNYPTCTFPVPRMTFVSKVPPDNSVIPVTAALPFTYSYTDATSFTENFRMFCNGTLVPTSVQITKNPSAQTPSDGTVVFAVTYIAPNGATCTLLASNIIATGQGGNSLPASVSTVLTTVP
jgi:hypothetical protein